MRSSIDSRFSLPQKIHLDEMGGAPTSNRFKEIFEKQEAEEVDGGVAQRPQVHLHTYIHKYIHTYTCYSHTYIHTFRSESRFKQYYNHEEINR